MPVDGSVPVPLSHTHSFFHNVKKKRGEDWGWGRKREKEVQKRQDIPFT